MAVSKIQGSYTEVLDSQVSASSGFELQRIFLRRNGNVIWLSAIAKVTAQVSADTSKEIFSLPSGICLSSTVAAISMLSDYGNGKIYDYVKVYVESNGKVYLMSKNSIAAATSTTKNAIYINMSWVI